MEAGWTLRRYEALPSTSDHCVALARVGEPGRIAVLAACQTAGRGSRGRRWDSPVGNLSVSLLLRPSGSVRDGGRWSVLAAVAMAEAVAQFLPDPAELSIKWPNDLLLGGRKLGGILLDSAGAADGSLDWLVLGFGANLAHAPAVPGRAVACLADFGPPPAPEQLAHGLMQSLERWQLAWAGSGFGVVRNAWLSRAQPLGSVIHLALGGQRVSGLFSGLSDAGNLLLETGGRVQAFATGELLQAAASRME